MPDTVKALSTSLLQIHRELEEAAWICGRGLLGTIRSIVLPLARPGVIAAMTLLFILAIRELGSSLFLYTSNTMVMAVLLLDYYEGGNVGITAAFSLVQTVLLAVVIGIAHLLSRGARGTETEHGPRRITRLQTREMKRMAVLVSKRQFGRGHALGAALAVAGGPAAAQNFGPPELIEAAKKEGKIVYYTADFTEVEQEIIKAFNKRFPFVKVEMVRAPGGQLITRIKTEAAAGKLSADVIDHSDRGLMLALQDLFQDYAPPNAADYREDVLVSPKLWPRQTLGWSIAYNTDAGEEPAQVLDGPDQARVRQQADRPGDRAVRRHDLDAHRCSSARCWATTTGRSRRPSQPVLYPSGAPLSDALVRGEISIAPLLYNIIYTKKQDGAPVEIFFPPEGVPVNIYGAGITKTAANPNAAKLFLNWCLSDEGQTFMIKELGYLTALKKPPVYPPGFDPKVVKVWVPNFEQYEKLRDELDRGVEQDLRLSAVGRITGGLLGRPSIE